jgi:hypothetical protein
MNKTKEVRSMKKNPARAWAISLWLLLVYVIVAATLGKPFLTGVLAYGVTWSLLYLLMLIIRVTEE